MIPEQPRPVKTYPFGDYYHLQNKFDELLIRHFRLKEQWEDMDNQVRMVVNKNRQLEAHNKMLEHVIALYPHPTATRPIEPTQEMV